MKVYFLESGSKNLMYAVRDKDLFYFSHTTHATMVEKDLDETIPNGEPTNKELCIDMIRKRGKYDASGLTKYYIDDDGDIAERDGWVEYIEEAF